MIDFSSVEIVLSKARQLSSFFLYRRQVLALPFSSLITLISIIFINLYCEWNRSIFLLAHQGPCRVNSRRVVFLAPSPAEPALASAGYPLVLQNINLLYLKSFS